jgi:hypothetical protein
MGNGDEKMKLSGHTSTLADGPLDADRKPLGKNTGGFSLVYSFSMH